MKRLILFCGALLMSGAVFAQENVMHIAKLEVPKRKKHMLRANNPKDSTLNVMIDTLIINDKADLQFFEVKKALVTVKHAVIGKQGIISGMDAHNNGTNMELKMRFDAIGSLFIISRGADYQTRPKFGNGDGGNVKLEYDSSGATPQFDDHRTERYVGVLNPGGGKAVNPWTDMYVIRSRIAMGSGVIGRPLTNLPQGRVYDGTPGTDGKKIIGKF
ncbi:MAG: hypothetical protein INR69_03015 [Mucilaginibacter polytrichastri]|nr:hypothetical protein [Mucilaginibacter polytrichastri]